MVHHWTLMQMKWQTILGTAVKLLALAAGMYYAHLEMKYRPRKKAAPPTPPPSPEGWPPPSEPPAVTLIRVETEEAATVSPASFIGSEYFGAPRVERERQEGESRRKRRKDPACAAEPKTTPQGLQFEGRRPDSLEPVPAGARKNRPTSETAETVGLAPLASPTSRLDLQAPAATPRRRRIGLSDLASAALATLTNAIGTEQRPLGVLSAVASG
jgi:hypothetical protein